VTGLIDNRLAEVVSLTTERLSELAALNGLLYVNERDHLQKCCADAALTLAAGWNPPPQVSTTQHLSSETWPDLGSIDIALTFSHHQPVAVELKCGAKCHVVQRIRPSSLQSTNAGLANGERFDTTLGEVWDGTFSSSLMWVGTFGSG
jgi:hypothetical protein